MFHKPISAGAKAAMSYGRFEAAWQTVEQLVSESANEPAHNQFAEIDGATPKIESEMNQMVFCGHSISHHIFLPKEYRLIGGKNATDYNPFQ